MSDQGACSSRRAFLAQMSAWSVGAAVLPAFAAQAHSAEDAEIDFKEISRQSAQIPQPDTLLKFSPDGTRKPFAGNTVICHLPAQCAVRDAMVDLHEDLARSPLVNKLGLTSVDSYHMTVFAGVNDQARNIYGWPSYVPPGASIDECNRLVGERMASATFGCNLPLKMRVDVPATLNHFSACTLRLLPSGEEQGAKLRLLRDQLAKVYGFRAKDHDQYVFHITLSYQVAAFTEQEQVLYRRMLRTHVQRIVAAAPILELGEPEYCVFPDMFRFEPKAFLACT